METTISTYEQQALNFLAKTGTTFSAEYLNHGKHFEGDKDTRDIYKISLIRGSRSYVFNFGQSINQSGEINLVEHLRNKMIAIPIVKKYGSNYAFNKKDRQIIMFETRLKEKDLPLNENYSAPTAYDVLACLTKHDPGTFENFCDDFGYDTDSKKAEKIYNAVKDEYANICKLFTDEQISELQEIN